MSEEKNIESYKAALEELQEIVQHLEGDLIGIDEINEKIQRSAALIKYCQDRLKKTEDSLNEMKSKDFE